MKKIQLFTTVIIAVTIFSSCSKEGPIGPAGPQGQTGATGATGTVGATGAAGTANVIYSPWVTTTFTGSGSSWTANITATEITQEILDKGETVVYFKSGSSVYKLNYIYSSYWVMQSIEVGKIHLYANIDMSYPYRYVVIPGGASSRQMRPDLNDYNAVCEFYNIQK